MLYDNKQIKPIEEINPETAEWDETVKKYKGNFFCDFPLTSTVNKKQITISPNGKVTLVAIPSKGRKIKFKFDLSKIR